MFSQGCQRPRRTARSESLYRTSYTDPQDGGNAGQTGAVVRFLFFLQFFLTCSPGSVDRTKGLYYRVGLRVWPEIKVILTSTHNRRERDHWGDLGVDGWIILGGISRRWDVGIWTGLGWPRIETGGGRL